MFERFKKNLAGVPALINPSSLRADDFLLTKNEVQKANELFEQKEKNNEPNPNRVTLYRGETKFSIIQFKEEDKVHRFVTSDLIGKGGSGKIKLMQNIETGEWMALKIMEAQEGSDRELLSREQEKDNLVRFGRSCGGFHQEAGIEKENGKLTKAKYFLAMKLAPGKDLKKQFLKKETIRIYSNTKMFDVGFATSNLDENSKKYFLKALHVVPVENQPDNLKVIYFVDGEKKENIFNKADFIDKCKQSSHLKLTNFSEFFSVQKEKIQIIQSIDNERLFNELKQIMQLDTVEVKPNLKIGSELADISYLMAKEVKKLHKSGLIHRDIKPEQFMYDEEKKSLKLIDLGSAVPIENSHASVKDGTTPLFTAPEIIKIAKFNTLYAAEQQMYKEYLDWKEKGFNGNFYGVKDTIDVNEFDGLNVTVKKFNIQTDIKSYSDFLKFFKWSTKVNLESDLYLMSSFPDSKLELYKNSYILVGKELRYITPGGQYQNIKMRNIEEFLLNISKINLKNESKLHLYEPQITRFITANGNHTPSRPQNSPENALKKGFDSICRKITNENKNAEFTTASDIYSFGLSIGQLFKLTERQGINVAFNLKSPEYTENEVVEVNHQALVIKDLEKAKLNNIYGLSDEDLSSLITMLKSMTAYSPADRPTIEQVERFFKDFSVKLNHATPIEKVGKFFEKFSVNIPGFSARSTQTPASSTSSTTTTVQTVDAIIEKMNPKQKKTRALEQFSQEMRENPTASRHDLKRACEFVETYFDQFDDIQSSDKSKNTKIIELKSLRKQLHLDLMDCGKIGRCLNNSKVIGGKENTKTGLNDFDTNLIGEIFMLNKILNLEQELNVTDKFVKSDEHLTAQTSTSTTPVTASTSSTAQIKTRSGKSELADENPLENINDYDTIFETIYNNYLKNGTLDKAFMSQLNVSFNTIALGLQKDANIKCLLTSGPLINELKASECTQFIKNNIEIYAELRGNERGNIRDGPRVAEGAKLNNIAMLAKTENLDQAEQIVLVNMLKEIGSSVKAMLAIPEEKEQPAQPKQRPRLNAILPEKIQQPSTTSTSSTSSAEETSKSSPAVRETPSIFKFITPKSTEEKQTKVENVSNKTLGS